MRQSFSTDFASAVLIFFLLLWWQSGWYRIDCALGQQSACDLIGKEYTDAAAKGKKP